ncbi:MAG: hypothetical protein OES57_05665 [Acidimicrobiia bacterium]|nr:hypothetical protein [Acidimicrobiia bacterium]
MRTFTTTAVTLALGLGVAACSDDAAALSRPDYVTQANAICTGADGQIAPIWEEFWSSVDPAQSPTENEEMFDRFVIVVDETASVWDDSLAALRDLGEPEGDEAELERLFDDFEAALAEFQSLVRAAADGSEEARLALEDEDIFGDVNLRARQYGLDVCGAED